MKQAAVPAEKFPLEKCPKSRDFSGGRCAQPLIGLALMGLAPMGLGKEHDKKDRILDRFSRGSFRQELL
jgi:hypothetical protein